MTSQSLSLVQASFSFVSQPPVSATLTTKSTRALTRPSCLSQALTNQRALLPVWDLMCLEIGRLAIELVS